ncbi:MAG: hypothetical protein ACREMK_13330 [Gemmatimonadota bacterium]
MRKHRHAFLFALSALLSMAIPLVGYAQTCLGLPTEGGDRLAALSFRPDRVVVEGAFNPLGPAGFDAGVARSEVPLVGETETRSVRLAFEEIEAGRFSLCPLVAIEHRRSAVGAEALRMPLGIGAGATFGSLQGVGWGPYATLGFLPSAPAPPPTDDLFRERPFYRASLVDRLGIMTWKGPLFATASLRALSAARPDVRIGIRF